MRLTNPAALSTPAKTSSSTVVLDDKRPDNGKYGNQHRAHRTRSI